MYAGDASASVVWKLQVDGGIQGTFAFIGIEERRFDLGPDHGLNQVLCSMLAKPDQWRNVSLSGY